MTLQELIAAHAMLQNVECGVDIGDGWVPLVDLLCRNIERHCKGRNLPIPEVGQVKEKFGGLRFYATTDPYIDGLIDMAEEISFLICEVCGERGEIREGIWLRTRCDAHVKAYG